MEINRCSRCGNFFATTGDVCPNCIAKDTLEQATFKNYLTTHSIQETPISTMSFETGITQNNLTRFIGYENL